MEYRISGEELLGVLESWDSLMTGRQTVHLIACGGTALSLLGYKDTTKDIDFLVPKTNECEYLMEFLVRAGYEQTTTFGWKRPGDVFIYDLYPGTKVYQTALLSSPLEAGGNKKIESWKRIYLGALNPIDLIITKMFRGTSVDVEDSLRLLRHEKIDVKKLQARYKETASYEVSQDRVLKNFEHFIYKAKKEGLVEKDG